MEDIQMPWAGSLLRTFSHYLDSVAIKSGDSEML
jgi:hypothetical protein